ncbi:MAG: hypothetical protein AAF357_04065 [Verrucomicrobiota bacterium]
MSELESSLTQALAQHPQDWSLRILVAEKILERAALQEAADTVNSAPCPPETEAQLHRLVELGGFGSIPLIESFISANPASGYAHTLLADLLLAHGDLAKAEQHRTVALALNSANAPAVAESESHAAVSEEAEVFATGEEGSPEAHAESDIEIPPISAPAPDLVEPTEFIDETAGLEKQFKGKPRGAKATAILVAIGVHLLIAIIATIVVILPPNRDEPEIVAAVIGPPAKKQEMQKKNVVKQTKKTSASSAAAAPLAQLMRANAMAKISLPNVTRTSKGPLGIGDADFGGGGFGGSGDGLGSGASFFGGTSTGSRFLFVLDQSGSMKAKQVKLRNDELEKALKGLNGVQYQVLLFAGGGYYASEGWSLSTKRTDNVVKGPDGTYVFKRVGGYSNYDFEGADSRLPKAEWLPSNAANVKKTMDRVKKDELFHGTDWGLALDIAHRMDPAPDVIFFMADGTGGNNPEPILRTNEKYGKPPINMIAMQTTSGSKEFAAIARRTKGTYIIVDKRGKPIDGFEYLKNPGKFKGKI